MAAYPLRFIAVLLFAGGLIMNSTAQAESRREKAEALVVEATETLDYFAQDSAFEPLWSLAGDAKALVIIPEIIRGGFVIGGAAGNALMIARTEDGGWSEPTFFTIGALSFGFQAGLEGSESVLAVMTQRGVERLLSTNVKLGADLTLAAGTLGAGAKAQTLDVIAFSRSRGLYGGVSLEGALLKSRERWNEAYYGADVSPIDIIYRERARQPASAQLKRAASSLAREDAPAQGYVDGPQIIAPVIAEPIDPLGGEEPSSDGLEAGEYEDDKVYGAPL